MIKKKFRYFSGWYNDNGLFFTYSTKLNERGDIVEFRIGDNDNDMEYWVESVNVELKNITDDDVFELIESWD